MTVKTLPLKDALAKLALPATDRNLFSSPEWMKVIVCTYGTRIFVKYIERDAKVSSYVFYTVVKNFLEWKICLCSYCDYCDGYVNCAQDWEDFFQDFRREYPSYRIAVRNLRDDLVRANPHFQLLSQEWFHLLNLQDSLEAIWNRTHESFRSAVKQGKKKEISVRVCEKKYLADFYRLHLRLRKNKYRVFPQPLAFFENIWNEYMERKKGFMLGAFFREQLVAANIYLECGNTLYYKFNTSDLSATHLRPNNVLFWEGIELAKKRGLEYLDLGSSGLEQKGLILFKEHAGVKGQYIFHLGFAPPGFKFSKKRILKAFTTICTRPWMPEAAVRWGSQIIYPYLA